MKGISRFFPIFKYPLRWLTRFQEIWDGTEEEHSATVGKPIVYVMRSTSKADLSILQRAAHKRGLPDPVDPLVVNGKTYNRIMYLEELANEVSDQTVSEFHQLLTLHKDQPELDVQLIPAGVFWGRQAGEEAHAGNTMTGDLDNPGHWRKFWLVIFSGRQVLLRFSRSVSLGTMARDHGTDMRIAHKLARVARVHFVRMRHAVAGPKLSQRKELMSALINTPALKKAVSDEVRGKKISEEAARKRALSYIDEIAANYNSTLIRVLDRFMTWMWNRIYNGIHVKGGDTIRRLAQQGHEVIYVPCHRSHMDYLLLSYVIYKEGLVPPHIAAGVNLNFFPVGGIFRRGGAFFIRRSFRGNKLYSAVFREYLCWLFQKGYPVEYFSEGGRSRTGRLLPPKTGMLAMTVQGMLRDQQRPVSLVPVYLGYEHIMEVATYLKELKGKDKEKESVFQILKTVAKLRNFGQGFVTFGQPINLKHHLDKVAPNWHESVTRGAQEPERPGWLNPVVSGLAEQVMQGINDSAAANSVNLTALALLSSEHHALMKEELLAQLDVYLGVLREVPYSNMMSVPDETPEELWQQALRTDKFTVNSDTMGEVVSLEHMTAIAMTYYRNNILHLMVVPGIVASIIMAKKKVSVAEIAARTQAIYPSLKAELYLSHNVEDLPLWTEALAEELARQQLITLEDGICTIAQRESAQWYRLRLLANSASETLQRDCIVLELLQQAQPIMRADLEKQSITLAERLSSIHGIDAPEFYDKKVMSTLIASLKQQGLVEINDHAQQIAAEPVGELSDQVDELIDGPVLQTIRQSVEQFVQQLKEQAEHEQKEAPKEEQKPTESNQNQ